MKKYIFAAFAGVAILASSCTKTIQSETFAASEDNGAFKFEVSFGQTKGVKTGWESGDKIVAFFDDATTAAATEAGAVKHVIFTYDGSDWTADQTNAPAAQELGETGTVKAVFCPFGPATIVPGDKAGEFYVGKSNAYFMQGSATYSKAGDKISFSMTMSLGIDNLTQIFIPGLAETQKWALSVYGNWTGKAWDKGLQKVWTAVFKPSTASFSAPTNTLGKPTDGYKTGGGFVFYGLASLGDNKELVFELYDNTDKVYYTYKKTGVEKFNGNMAVKLPELSGWTKVSANQVNLYADGLMIINEKPNSRSGNILAHGPSQKVCDNVANDKFSGGDNGTDSPWNAVRSSIKTLAFGSPVTPKSLQGSFIDCVNLVSVDCTNLNMENCQSLKYTFKNCPLLETLDVSGWNTAKVADMRYTFHDCKKLKVLDVSRWDVSNVGNIYGAFRQCESIEVLDMSKWTNTKIARLNETFRGMSKVKVLDISWVPYASITETTYMFYQCFKLQTIYATGNLTSATKKDREFYQCSSLRGGNGTQWSESNVGADYARIDADGTPGYFTQK